MSVRAIEAEVSIKSGVQVECSIGREVIVEVHDDVNLETLTATENGSYRPESGVDGWDRVTVNVPERQPITEPLSVTANGQYEPSEGVDGFSDVTVSVPERIPVTESLLVTENGTYEPTEGIDGYDRVVVDVPPTVPEIEALTVTEDGTYTASGDGYNPVTVNTGVASLRQEIQSAETASGCSPLVDGLTALTTYANEVTGQEDETLSDAVETLASGYGAGGYSDDVDDFSGGNIQALISHASEYIDTGYYPHGNLEVMLKASKDTFYKNYEGLFCALYYNDDARIGVQLGLNGDISYGKYFCTLNFGVGGVVFKNSSPNIITARGVNLKSTAESTSPFLIFHAYYNAKLDVPSGYNFYGLKCYETGVLMHKYVPWLDENNVPCVKDLVEDELFYNVGTGGFDYIDANGNTVTLS